MPTQSQKDLGSVLIVSVWSLFGYSLFLCFVPMSWIKWCLIGHVVPIWLIRMVLHIAVVIEKCFA
jgi:hypothetical protein